MATTMQYMTRLKGDNTCEIHFDKAIIEDDTDRPTAEMNRALGDMGKFPGVVSVITRNRYMIEIGKAALHDWDIILMALHDKLAAEYQGIQEVEEDDDEDDLEPYTDDEINGLDFLSDVLRARLRAKGYPVDEPTNELVPAEVVVVANVPPIPALVLAACAGYWLAVGINRFRRS